MTNFKIIYVNETKIFTIKNLQNKKFARKYHALGIHYLIETLKKNYKIYSIDEAMLNINKYNWDVRKCLIIQELSSKKGDELIKLGAMPFLWICFEGPFIGHMLYEKIQIYARKFSKLIIYNNIYPGLEDYKSKIVDTGFPCIEDHRVHDQFIPLTQEEWDSKKIIVGIWSNKHYSLNSNKIIYHVKNFNYKYILSEIISKLISKTYKKNKKYQLIDKRLEVFLGLSKLTNFDLYGRGWNKKHETPNKLFKKILNYKNFLYDGEDTKYIDFSKKQIYKQYKFSLCFENSISSSYLAEKIFDCFINKIIPIYLGAPNINDLVPEECFIDYRKFKDNNELFFYLKNMKLNEANRYLLAAHNFITSEKISRNSCQHFSNLIKREIDNYIKDYKD